MKLVVNKKLTSDDPITSAIKNKGIYTWSELSSFVQQLPYGRNANRKDLSLILTEGKGTCSSKHAFLKTIADLNTVSNVKLILGMYKMNEINTPGIAPALSNNCLKYIPEAHCYLTIEGIRFDFTNSRSDIGKIEKEIMFEKEISPDQVISYKVEFHQGYLKNWLKENNINRSFDEIWKIREKCIEQLKQL